MPLSQEDENTRPASQGVGACFQASFVVLLLCVVVNHGTATAQSQGVFTATGKMTSDRYGHTATLLLDGRVLVAGGISPSTGIHTNSAELYDPVTGAFTATGSMTTPRVFHAAILLASGKVLVVGGNSTNTAITAEIYDPSTGAFTFVAEAEMRAPFVSTVLLANGKVLVEGLQAALLFDTDASSFTDAGTYADQINQARMATLLADGKVLITGDNWEGVNGAWSERGMIYDPQTGSFSPSDQMPWSEAYAATLLPNGKVLFTGGYLELDDKGLDGTQLFDPSAGAFNDAGRMTTNRYCHTSTLLSDGTVLIAGSQRAYGALAKAEVYDPATGAFSPTSDMLAPRNLHTATLLADGSVLIAGGAQWIVSPVPSAEIYHPTKLVPAPVLLSLSGEGRGQGAILHAGTSMAVTAGDPAVAGEALEIYGTGLIDGAVIPPQVSIGGRMAEVLSFGKASDASEFAGQNQVVVQVPSGVPPGSAVPVRLTYLGRPSNEVTIGMQ